MPQHSSPAWRHSFMSSANWPHLPGVAAPSASVLFHLFISQGNTRNFMLWQFLKLYFPFQAYPTEVHITAVLVRYKTSTGRVNRGVATSFLALKHPPDGKSRPRTPIFIRKSKFKLPVKPETSIIMIGPGTGVAPFRGFIQERDFLKARNETVGDTILYFGCRKRSEDFIYQEASKFLSWMIDWVIEKLEQEFEEYASRGSLHLRLAFSRDQPKKVYVTNLMEQDADIVWDVIGKKEGKLYFCG